MKSLATLFLVSAAAIGAAQSTPEAALRGFVDAWNRKDLRAASTFVYGGKYDDRMALSMANASRDGWPHIAISNVKVDLQRGSATLSFTSLVTMPRQRDERQSDHVDARRAGSAWKLVPGEEPRGADAPIRSLSYMFAHPELVVRAHGAAKATMSLSKVKQLGTAVLMFSGDNHDRIAFTAAGARRALRPYLKSEELWTAPDDPKGTMSYHFNPAMLGRSLSAVAAPAETVLLYEGKDGKLNFRYRGRAAVCFADGHAKLINRATATRLRWKP